MKSNNTLLNQADECIYMFGFFLHGEEKGDIGARTFLEILCAVHPHFEIEYLCHCFTFVSAVPFWSLAEAF